MLSKLNFPHIGHRILKSAAGVFLCFIVYLLRNRNGIPLYTMLAVLWCVQPYTDKTMTMAYQRTVGTLIGAFFGLITILLEIYIIPVYDTLAGFAVISAMIIPVIYTTVVINKKNASYFSCVVFLSITVSHLTDENPFLFVFNRTLDTFIGIIIGVVVNSARMPRKKVKDKLFVAELDDMLSPVKDELQPYSKVEINRMLSDGLKLTISTMRTPASLMKPLADIHLNMPVVVMNGAALYDIKENTYVKAYIISNSTCLKIKEIIDKADMNCFINALSDDNLMIYYDRLENQAERTIFSQLKKSPYRNYIKRAPSSEDRVIYLMIIDKSEKIAKLYKAVSESEVGSHIKILTYPSDDFKGYSYIKIYNKNANKHNMIQYLMDEYGISSALTIGAHDNNDIKASGRSLNSIAKELKRNFKPMIFTK